MMHMDGALSRLEENEEYQKIIECVSEGSEGEVQQEVQNYLAYIQEVDEQGTVRAFGKWSLAGG